MSERHAAVVVGAGPAGLAAAAMLRRAGVDPLVVERGQRAGASWAGHYERLHLHTSRRLSGLPGFPIPRRYGRWVARDGVVAYLEEYARRHRLVIRGDTEVTRVERHRGGWRLATTGGDVDADAVVVATGYNHIPHVPPWPGLAGYRRQVWHSCCYRNPRPFRGRDILVVGAGNSAAEIAADLAEGGARRVRLAVRTPPHVVRRDVLGVPSQVLAIALWRLPPPLVDPMAAALRRLTVGDLSRHGLPPPREGLYAQFRRTGVIPILDVGLVHELRAGRVEAVPAVDRFEADAVALADGRRIHPDAVIAATGYRRGLEPLVAHLGVLRPDGRPRVHGRATLPGLGGLHFIGYTNPIGGNLRALGPDARKIARTVARRTRASSARGLSAGRRAGGPSG